MFTTGTATDYNDLFDKLCDYVSLKGSAFGLVYSGTGTGTLTDYSGGADSVAETFTITATSATNFTVVGSVTGSLPAATVGTPYSEGEIEFTLTAGGTAFVSGDEFTISTAPKWTVKRKARGCSVLATEGNTGQYGVQNVVDGKIATDNDRRFNTTVTSFPFDIEFEFVDAETITDYELGVLLTNYPSYLPKDWTFDYWTGSAWVTLDTVTGETSWTETEIRSFEVGAPVSANKYRLHITAGNVSSYLAIGAVRLRRADGIDAAFAGGILEAPGNDGDSEILVGIHLFERQDADYFNWEICGFDAFAASSAFYQQAGFHGELYLPLWDASIPYWFIADGRRVIVVAKLNTQYEIAYLGLADAYFTPDQWPYPLVLGGSLALGDPPTWESTDFRWSKADSEHQAFTHSDPGSGALHDVNLHQLRARDWSGDWRGFRGLENDAVPYPTSLKNLVWPVCCGLSFLDTNLDGGTMRWPVMLNTGTPNTIGELRGVAVISGQGLTAETTLEDGAIEWMAFHNITRTDRDDFLAIALD
jgi:hypothetical protein